MLLYIVRHGEPIYGPDTLTDLGRLQAQAVAERFAVHGLDRIFSSPQGRAKETAQPTAEKLGLEIQIEPWTREIWPELTLKKPDGSLYFAMQLPGRYLRSEENHDLNSRWYEMDALKEIDAKGAYEDIVVAHSDDFLRRLGYERQREGVYRILRENNERVALFCHAGFTLTYLPHLLAIPPHLFWAAFDLTHSGVTCLEFKDDGTGHASPKCLFLSDMSHILKADLPYRYNNLLPV